MASRTRSKLAAVLGAAVLTATAPAEASSSADALRNPTPARDAATTTVHSEATETLGDVIESRLVRAHDAGRHAEIEQLGTLWMTLKQRSQLERQVDSGERFVAAALRNQRVSSYRQAARLGRFVPAAEPALDSLAGDHGVIWQAPAGWRAPDERLAAAELLERLDEPYRTAVILAAEGLNRREVAEQMGVTHEAVRKWMQRLRQRWTASEA